MLRFAPSPTGDLHIGNLRVAIFNYIVSKQKKEDFIVRIEDTEKEKNIEAKDQEVLDLLALFNIHYSQVIYQSENIRFHSAMALQLLHEKKAFSCFCSPQWLEKKQKESKEAKKAYSYDDACRNLPAELVIDNTSPFTIRITRPDITITINDQIKGRVNFEDIDSFVIMSQDKIPTHNFSAAVDDMLNDITLIIRDEHYINDTAQQIHIRKSLSYDKEITYAHLPTILNDSNNPVSVKSLLEQGYLPEAILNYLILLGNEVPKKIFTMEEAIEWFDLSKISKNPTPFDIEMLKTINKEHLKNLDAKELSRYLGFADAEIGELAYIYLEEVTTTVELRSKIAPIFSERDASELFRKETDIMIQTIKSAPYFEEYEDFKNHIMKESGIEEDNFSQLFRILLTNAETGPELAKIYKCLKNYIGEIIK